MLAAVSTLLAPDDPLDAAYTLPRIADCYKGEAVLRVDTEAVRRGAAGAGPDTEGGAAVLQSDRRVATIHSGE